MNIKCPKCGVGIRIDESKHAPGSLLRVTCPKCREVLSVGIPGLASAAPASTPQSVQFTSSPTSKHYLTLRFNGATKRVTDDAVTIYIDGKRVTGNFSKYKDAFSLTGGFSIQIPIRFPEIKISIYLSNALHGSQYKVPVNMPCDYLMLLKYDEATGTFSEVYELKEV